MVGRKETCRGVEFKLFINNLLLVKIKVYTYDNYFIANAMNILTALIGK